MKMELKTAEELYKDETGREAWIDTGEIDELTRNPVFERRDDYIDWLEGKIEQSNVTGEAEETR